MSIVCVCITVKIQFDNTCKYPIILTLRSVDMRPRVFGPPFKNSGSAPGYYHSMPLKELN